MFFGKCRQKIAPDSPNLRVRTPSKSHATPLGIVGGSGKVGKTPSYPNEAEPSDC